MTASLQHSSQSLSLLRKTGRLFLVSLLERTGLVLLVLLVCLALLPGCSSKKGSSGSSASYGSARGTYRPYTVGGKTYYPLKSARGYVKEGVASWYGPGFHGKKTASGETYNQYSMTAAHTILPMNTKVRVTNLRNGRSVTLRINDRGPFVDNRIIDLSLAAAQRLGITGKGTARVRVESMDQGAATASATPARRTATDAGGGYNQKRVPALKGAFYVQAGVFSDRRNADALASSLSRNGHRPRVSRTQKGLWRVQAGPWENLDAANDAMWRIRRLSSAAFIVSGDRM